MRRLVIGILAHVDAGKTTLSEAILYKTERIRKLGRVDKKDAFLDNFRNNDWYGGFTDYLNECGYLLEESINGTPVDIMIPDDYYPEPYKPTFMDYVKRFLLMLVPSFIASLIVCAILRAKSKAVHMAVDANRYIGNGLRLMAANEMFLHRAQTRRRLDMDNRVSINTGGGGSHPGGTTVNSSGFSGKSGKF